MHALITGGSLLLGFELIQALANALQLFQSAIPVNFPAKVIRINLENPDKVSRLLQPQNLHFVTGSLQSCDIFDVPRLRKQVKRL